MEPFTPITIPKKDNCNFYLNVKTNQMKGK